MEAVLYALFHTISPTGLRSGDVSPAHLAIRRNQGVLVVRCAPSHQDALRISRDDTNLGNQGNGSTEIICIIL